MNTTSPAPTQRLATAAKVVLFAAICSGATGLLVHLQNQATLTAFRAEAAQELAASEQARATLEGLLAEANHASSLRHARLLVFDALDELDQRNFGSAQASVDAGAAALQAWMDATGSTTLDAVQLGLQTYTLSIDSDIGASRDRLAQMGRGMDGTLDATPVTYAIPASDAESPGSASSDETTGAAHIPGAAADHGP